MFGKIMRVPDALLPMYYQLLTDVPEPEYTAAIAGNPRDAKVRLAKILVTWLHSDAAADQAERDFFAATHGGVPDSIPELSIGPGPHRVAPLLVKAGFVASNSEAIRKIREGGIKLDGEKWTNEKAELTPSATGHVLQMGSRRFVRIKP
jgi:tyrosyl-tRNA synthetase